MGKNHHEQGNTPQTIEKIQAAGFHLIFWDKKKIADIHALYPDCFMQSGRSRLLQGCDKHGNIVRRRDIAHEFHMRLAYPFDQLIHRSVAVFEQQALEAL